MAHSVSAKKRIRQNARRHEENRQVKSRIRTARRAFQKACEANDVPGAKERLRAAAALLHRAGNRGPLHSNTAGRTISRMQTRLTALETTATAK